MRAFDDLVRAGKVLYVGISDAPAWVVAKSNTLAELRGWTRYVGLQIEYSLLERTVERELVPMARDQQMTVLAWSPLRNGLLTGKYLPENVKQSEADGARMHSEMMKGFGSVEDSTHATVREIVAVGDGTGRFGGAGRLGVAALPCCSGDSHHRRAQAHADRRQHPQPERHAFPSTDPAARQSHRRILGLPAGLHGAGACQGDHLRRSARSDQSLIPILCNSQIKMTDENDSDEILTQGK